MINRMRVDRIRFLSLKYLSLCSWFALGMAVYLTIGLAWFRYATVAGQSVEAVRPGTHTSTNSGADDKSQPAALPLVFAPVQSLVEYQLPSFANLSVVNKLEVQGRFIELLLVMVAVSMSIVPALYIPYKLRVERTKHPLQMYVAESERERNEIMLDRYRNAQHVTLYAGSFDWICKDNRLAETIVNLANQNKIDFVSTYKREQVEKALRDHSGVCAAIMGRFKQRDGEKVVCSLIKYHANYSFMYLHWPPNIGGQMQKPRICEVTDVEEGRYLLNVMRELLTARSTVSIQPASDVKGI